ncbi:MAG: melibiase, partial [Candidatus Korobacteraceae bacterium]
MSKMRCGWLCNVGIAIIAAALMVITPCAAQQLTNDKLSLSVNAKDGAYQLAVRGGQIILTSRVAAQVNHQWLRSTDYPRHQVSESAFSDELGSGRAITVTNSGLPGKADLIYMVQLYDQNPYATLQVTVRNSTEKEVTVQAIRGVESLGEPLLNLGGPAFADRVLSDSFSEDWPQLRLYDLGKAPGGMHRGVGSQLVYNRESRQSLFVGALTADRFLTILHLQTAGEGAGTKIASYGVDFTGTTEIQKDFDLKDAPAENLVELSLPIASGSEIVSERLMLQAGQGYYNQLLAYGDAIRRL